MTDGQIYLETELCYQGIRPAISVGLSVSRVGGAAQAKAVKGVAGALRLDLAQFRELAAFAQFSTDLDAETKQRIDRGQRLTELLKQGQYSPLSVAEQVVLLIAGTSGAFDAVPLDKVEAAKEVLLKRAHSDHKGVLANINQNGTIEKADEERLTKLAQEVAKDYKPEEAKA